MDLVQDEGSGPTDWTPKQDLRLLHGTDHCFELTDKQAAFLLCRFVAKVCQVPTITLSFS